VRVSNVQWSQGTQSRLWRGLNLSIELTAPLSAAAIQFIEDNRGSGDVALQLDLTYQWYEVAARDGDKWSLGPVNWNQHQAHCPVIARSNWLALLTDMKWTEIEIFEVPSASFGEFQDLPAATARMRQAETSLRSGDYNGVLAHCRAAMEAAAKAQARSDEVKKGFELLFSAALPEHAEKRKILSEFVQKLSDYAHLGRHESFPALQITKSEAQFVYTSTLGLFSFLGRRLSNMETVGVRD
jgi:hypothetical protein